MWFRYTATLDVLITTQEVARLIHIATSTLENHRRQPTGQILYWVAQLQNGTSVFCRSIPERRAGERTEHCMLGAPSKISSTLETFEQGGMLCYLLGVLRGQEVPPEIFGILNHMYTGSS